MTGGVRLSRYITLDHLQTLGEILLQHRLLWRAAAVTAAVSTLLVVLLRLGLCLPELRILKDSDYFKAAIVVVINDPVDGVVRPSPGAIVLDAVHSQRYSSAGEFMSEFPNCCRFVTANTGDSGPSVSVWDLLTGVRVVEVSYVKRYTDVEGNERSDAVVAKIAVTCCGNGRPYR